MLTKYSHIYSYSGFIIRVRTCTYMWSLCIVSCDTSCDLLPQEDIKKIDKSKKKLSNARLDMDSARARCHISRCLQICLSHQFHFGCLLHNTWTHTSDTHYVHILLRYCGWLWVVGTLATVHITSDAHTHTHSHTHTHTHSHTRNSCKTLIGVHEMHGRMHPN